MSVNKGRNKDGRFAKGAPGRPPGALNRTTRIAQSLLDGEAEGLTRRAIELALAGDATALKLCLDRVVPAPKGRHVAFELPALKTPADAVAAAGALVQAVSRGDLTPGEGAQVMGLIDAYRRTCETADLARRLERLEASVG
ncbi:hypothetical protein [Paracoccus niistensis]|uniref:DUF5681 domain-containing protein n=1 Tax=Paracoccus niistensis TaxID=632935 RepID=A0ABV6I3G7_9RHOB